MGFCKLHQLQYHNRDDECPLCARETEETEARGIA